MAIKWTRTAQRQRLRTRPPPSDPIRSESRALSSQSLAPAPPTGISESECIFTRGVWWCCFRNDRTETCSFSEGRIYPGHGSRYIRRDGTSYVFLNAKSKSLFLQRKKPTKIVWTLGWRRMNKKIKVRLPPAASRRMRFLF